MPQAPANLPAILEAAMGVFFRFGFRKASMDDVAAAAGLSRQGLYLKFRTKEHLFEAALKHLIGRLLDTARALCAEDGVDIESRLTGLFEALHGGMIGTGSRTDSAELLELARSRHAALVAGFERDFIAIAAALLTESGVAGRWEAAGLSARQVAEHLLMAASGIKASVTSGAEYRARMAVAAALVVRGAPGLQRPPSRSTPEDRP